MQSKKITIRGARQHNLKNINLEIPSNALTVITGVSGSGKSSLAFDTLAAEGQRRYVESLSAYARQFLSLQNKPDVDLIEGLSPSITIEQKTTSRNPRSTVGTVTEIYDYLRLLYARIGHPSCYKCGQPIQGQTVSQMVDNLMLLPERSRLHLCAPIVRGRKGEYRKMLLDLQKQGYTRAIIDGESADLATPPKLNKFVKHNIDILIDRIIIKSGIETRLADSIETALKLSEGLLRVEILSDPKEERLFSEHHACIDCNISYPDIEPRLFSFNNPHGACPKCDGLGTEAFFDEKLVIPDPTRSLTQGAIEPWAKPTAKIGKKTLLTVAKFFAINPDTPWQELSESQRELLLYGDPEKTPISFRFRGPRGSFSARRPWLGILSALEKRFKETESDDVREDLKKYRTTTLCPHCQGDRLRKEALHFHVGKKNIADLVKLPLDRCQHFFQKLSLSQKEQEIATTILKEIQDRLGFLTAVGLNYLTLDRTSGTLSGGESQRIRLANQIGSGLVGVLYILDEPSIGLHQRDNQRLLQTLIRLRDLGNTVVVVEHDEEAIRVADYIVDMGPGPGDHGGEVVATGTPEAIKKNSDSLTGCYLSGKKAIQIPEKRLLPDKKRQLIIHGARTNNLDNIDISIPLGLLVAVTGVSGSGKSSLILDTLYPALAQKLHRSQIASGDFDRITGLALIDKVIHIDQSPIGRTPRSNPSTYTGLFTPIRELFAKTPEAQSRGYKAGRFSFNVKGGRCEACKGEGLIKIEMHFLPDIFVECDVCHGARFNRETLEIFFKNLNIADILNQTIEDAANLFQSFPAINNKLQTLIDVGLGYLRLGQAATTLSGGEAQRIKIARELSKRASGKTLYILDEPTTGLHFEDIRRLLEVLQRLVKQGNSVVVIEHNLDIIKAADWLIDLGPEGGSGGGTLVAEGTPEQLVLVEKSWTGQFLRPLLT
ncbi:excinuclease ABC subunit UvrA [Magnetococcales bacterium HHB-1]